MLRTLLLVLLALAGVRDVPAAFDAVPERAVRIPLALDATELPAGGHVQGVQCLAAGAERHCFVSGSADEFAYVMRIDLLDAGATKVRWLQNVSGAHPEWRHAGGFQLSGTTLAVGLEDATGRRDAQVQLWDVSGPSTPRRLPCAIARHGAEPETHTAGAVGIVATDERYVVLVANWDSRALDFYATDSLLLDSASCGLEHVVRWSASGADRLAWRPDREWGAYQAVSLLVDREQRLFVVGTHTAGTLRRHDIADLFVVDLEADASKILRKLASKRLHLAGASFRCGGGVVVQPTGQLAVQATGCSLADFVVSEARVYDSEE